MKRELEKLAENKFDIIIIGGGIYGASLAWLASLENFNVALIEKNDFAGGTSSNSQKIIHGGLRYLAKLDFYRIKESVEERKRLMWLAPHLVYPLPCVVPVYGRGLNGKEGMEVGFKIYNLISRKRNEIPDKEKYIPGCELLSKEEISSLVPGIDQHGLTAGAKWYDGFCFNTERLILSFLKSASENGSVIANYVSAEKILVNNSKVLGVEVVDNLNNEKFNILAGNVINCTGVGINNLSGDFAKVNYPLVSGINIVTKKIFDHNSAVGIKGKEKKSRYYFVVPWKDKSIIGTNWSYNTGVSLNSTFNESECKELVDDFNRVYPQAGLNINDIKFVHKGFVYGKENLNTPSETLNDYKIYDESSHHIKGLINVIGVKYTTAVDVAERVLKKVNPSYRKKNILDQPKLAGGNFENLSEFSKKTRNMFGLKIGKNSMIRLIKTYGSELEKVLSYSRKDDAGSALKAEVLFSINEEMAISLSDVFLRRTGLGDSEQPSVEDISYAANIMAEELKWTSEKTETEKNNLVKNYPDFVEKNERVLN